MRVFSLCDATVKQIGSFSGGYTGFRGRFATVCGRYAFSSFFLPAPSPIAATPSPMYPSPSPPPKKIAAKSGKSDTKNYVSTRKNCKSPNILWEQICSRSMLHGRATHQSLQWKDDRRIFNVKKATDTMFVSFARSQYLFDDLVLISNTAWKFVESVGKKSW